MRKYSYSSGSSENIIIVSNSSDPEQVPRLQGPIWVLLNACPPVSSADNPEILKEGL